MNTGHEEEQVAGALFNPEVFGLLFKYIFRYRPLLFRSILFVLVITATTLTVPYLSRIVIDKQIIKRGLLTDISKTDRLSPNLAKQIRKGVPLVKNEYFLFQSSLSRFSSRETDSLKKAGVFSKSKYLLVESPVMTDKLNDKIALGINRGQVLRFSSKFLVTDEFLHSLSVGEIISLRDADFRRIGLFVCIVIVLFILQFACSYLQITTLMKLSQKAMRDLRTDLFKHLISLELSYFDKNPVGKLVNRVTNDIESLNEMFSSVLITVFQDILIMSGVVIIMYITDPRLSFIISLTFPPLLAATMIFRTQARRAYRVIRTRIADLNAFLNENISGIRIVQIFGREKSRFEKFSHINNSVYLANMRQIYTYAVFRPLIDFFRWVAVACVIYFGAHLILKDGLTFGIMVMFIAYIGSFFEPIGDLAEKFDLLQSATAAGEKILSVFKAHAKNESHGSYLVKPFTGKFKGEVVFDNVWFSYIPNEWVLKGISFSIEPQSTLAIVGETGSGKSTIINLLGKYYPIQKGGIFIDGQNIETMPIYELRRNMAVVMQDVFLFSRTLKENLTLGNEFNQAHFAEIVELTHTDKFIKSLSNGLEEQVMERGVTFSSGERQLLAFARALYNNPSLLILDEATSNIDTETERLIQDAIARLIRGRTSIIIAHRLSTVRHASKIIVIDKGKIAEEGNHDDLMSKKGLYYELYRLQFSD